MSNPGFPYHSEGNYDHEGKWEEVDESGSGIATYHMSYVASTPGNFAIHLYYEEETQQWNVETHSYVRRTPLPGSPFLLSVHSNVSDQLGRQIALLAGKEAGIDTSGQKSPSKKEMATAKEYKINRNVFEDVQKQWGVCTIDAFASAATALIPRFWTEKKTPGAEGTDAFKQTWQQGEVIWAHPPPEHLGRLASFLAQPTRMAEVIVVAPIRPTEEWMTRFEEMCDDSIKHMHGTLIRVADDAPERVQDWAVMLYHIPAPAGARTPLDRLPDWLRYSHDWSPGWFTSGTWRGSSDTHAGIQRVALQVRSAVRVRMRYELWLRRAQNRLLANLLDAEIEETEAQIAALEKKPRAPSPSRVAFKEKPGALSTLQEEPDEDMEAEIPPAKQQGWFSGALNAIEGATGLDIDGDGTVGGGVAPPANRKSPRSKTSFGWFG
jgi:hypothetical protein